MKHILVMPTMRCNLRCQHCIRGKYSNQDLPIELLEKYINEVKKKYKFALIGFTGGEPTTYKYYFKLFDLIRKYELQTYFITNGQDSNAIDKICENWDLVKLIALSLEGPDAETNDKIRGKGAFKKAIANIQKMRQANVPVKLRTVFLDENRHLLPRFFDFCDRYDIHAVRFTLMQPIQTTEKKDLHFTEENYAHTAKLFKMLKQQYPHIDSKLSLKRIKRKPTQQWSSDVCKPYDYRSLGFTLLPDGNISYCCDLVDFDYDHSRYQGDNTPLDHILGNIAHDTIDDIIAAQKTLSKQLYERRKHDIKQGLITGSREHFCENCQFYFNHNKS